MSIVRMMATPFNKRIAFISLVLRENVTKDAILANNWYISNDGKNTPNDVALLRFSAWIHSPAVADARSSVS